jgi:RNA polymerase sigma-70 factor, ECF subfamily
MTHSLPSERISTLYRQLGPVIFSRCRRLLREEAAAQDATQEVFLRVLEHVDSIPTARAVPWVHRIATNYCYNVLRNERRRAEMLGAEMEPRSGDDRSALANRNAARWLMKAAPEALRAPAWQFYVEERGQEEIAVQLGVSRRTVINRLQAFLCRTQQAAQREGLVEESA